MQKIKFSFNVEGLKATHKLTPPFSYHDSLFTMKIKVIICNKLDYLSISSAGAPLRTFSVVYGTIL